MKPKAVLLGTVVVLVFKHMSYADYLLSAGLELYANFKVSTTEVAADLGINRHVLDTRVGTAWDYKTLRHSPPTISDNEKLDHLSGSCE